MPICISCTGFATVTPLLLSKNIGYDILDDESLTDVFTRVDHSDLGYGPYVNSVYSGWKSVDNYDTCANVFVVLFNGFMSLTSYFDVMYRY